MDRVVLKLEDSTDAAILSPLVAAVLDSVSPVVSQLAASAGLEGIGVRIRITDAFVPEVEARRATVAASYDTERIGGMVAAMVCDPLEHDDEYTVLINSAAFPPEDSHTVVHLPATVGHELAHCLISECRRQYGSPQGYSKSPANPLESVGFTALSVCDEYLADEMAKTLVPSLNVVIESDQGPVEVVDRVVLAVDRLSRMTDDLDSYLHPKLGDTVQAYRERRLDLDTMLISLVSGIQGGLIASAHYRSATRDLGTDMPEVVQVAAHPASSAYLVPFWSKAGPVLEARLRTGPLDDFSAGDQHAFDVATEAITGLWSALGIEFELMPDGRVYAHVDAPEGWR